MQQLVVHLTRRTRPCIQWLPHQGSWLTHTLPSSFPGSLQGSTIHSSYPPHPPMSFCSSPYITKTIAPQKPRRTLDPAPLKNALVPSFTRPVPAVEGARVHQFLLPDRIHTLPYKLLPQKDVDAGAALPDFRLMLKSMRHRRASYAAACADREVPRASQKPFGRVLQPA
jgi:hypothetical protein